MAPAVMPELAAQRQLALHLAATDASAVAQVKEGGPLAIVPKTEKSWISSRCGGAALRGLFSKKHVPVFLGPVLRKMMKK